ncbi:MAG: YggU family protein [Alphaproteobacteria bacterium CG_4_10_14_0_2_um_filter_63_37]|nr:MAG: YggU family protein [Proteobacteria bacterium CG1_02_64_396]PJA24930.1 MAG: YggU family protein [Alphaproteobacteria bacterium CG_4_10_14_0_2_um_filter_63_37]
MSVQRNPDGSVTLVVHAQPGAKRTELAGLHGEAVKIRVASPPVDGKANAALIAFLAKLLGVRKGDVIQTAGQTSREKRFRIEGVDDGALICFQNALSGLEI